MIVNRRSFVTGLISLVAAPAIVRVSSIMPVKTMEPYIQTGFTPCELISFGAGLTETQTAAFYARIKTFQEALVAGELWDKLESVQVFGAPTEELALTNWKEKL